MLCYCGVVELMNNLIPNTLHFALGYNRTTKKYPKFFIISQAEHGKVFFRLKITNTES